MQKLQFLDNCDILRYLIFPHVFWHWYRLLDRLFPGAAVKNVVSGGVGDPCNGAGGDSGGDPNFGDPFLMMLRAARMWCMVTFLQKPFSKAKKAFLSFFLLGFYKSCKCRHQILGNHCLNNQKPVWII